jgi:hypothetical protein
MHKTLVFVLILSVALSVYGQQPPGVRAVVMNSGLNTLAKDLIPLFVKTMIELQVPDYNGVENIPILGNIDYTLSNMKFTKVEVGDIMLGTSPPNVVSVAVYAQKTSLIF